MTAGREHAKQLVLGDSRRHVRVIREQRPARRRRACRRKTKIEPSGGVRRPAKQQPALCEAAPAMNTRCASRGGVAASSSSARRTWPRMTVSRRDGGHASSSTRSARSPLPLGGDLQDRGVDQPLDGRAVVGVDLPPRRPGREPPPPRARRGAAPAGSARPARRAAAAPRRGRRACVFDGSLGSRRTWRNASRIVAHSACSSASLPSGWPTLTITTPPGFRRARGELEELLGREVERDVGLAVGVDEDRVVAARRRAQERPRVGGVHVQAGPAQVEQRRPTSVSSASISTASTARAGK